MMFASTYIPPAQCGADDCTGCQSVQYNDVNPILVDLRSFRGAVAFLQDPRGLYASWNFTFNHASVDDSTLVTFLYPRATVGHLRHARRVLARLATLTEGART